MRFIGLRWNRRVAFPARLAAAAFLLSIAACVAQDSAGESSIPRVDRPEIAITVRDSAGAIITAAGTVKLYLNATLADTQSLSHGRAFFGSIAFGDYTLVVEVTGYKSVQKDMNISVAMRYEIDANLQREGADSEAPGSARPLLAPKAKEALDKALKALGANKLSEAQKQLDEALKLAPFHPDVLYAQGVLLLDQKNWAQAEGVLEKASQMDPTNAQIFAALGMALADEGKYDAAISPLEKSVKLETGRWETQWALGKAYYHDQRYDDALKASQLAWTESNGKVPQIELLVAQSLTAVGKYDDAAQALRDFLKRYSDRPEAPTARRWLDGLASNGKIHSN